MAPSLRWAKGMKKLPFLIATAAVAAFFAVGCECTMVGCSIGSDEGVQVTVTGAVKTFAGNMPVTYHLCAGATCADFVVKDLNGTTVCDDGETPGLNAPDERACFLGTDDLEIVLSAEMPGDSSEVSLTIKDGSGTVLFDDKQTVPVAAYEPNGEMCGPACRTSEATFNPGPASQ